MEKKKYYIVIAGIIIVLLAAGWFLFGRTGSETSNNVDRTVSGIKGYNESAGREINNTRQQITDASANTARTTERIERSEEIINSNSATITECRELVKQCRYDNQTAKSIINEIEQSNKAGTAASKEKPG